MNDANFLMNSNFIENIISLMPGHVYWKDIHGVYLGCNDLQAVSLGLSSRQVIIGKTDYDLAWKEQAKEIRKLDMLVMQTGKLHTVEETATVSDGTKVIFLTKKVPLRDKNNIIVGIVGISFDITERKALELQLRSSKLQTEIALENIIEHLPGHVYWQDNNLAFLGCNKKQAISAGLASPKEIIGKTNYDLPWKDQADILNKLNYEVIATGQEHTAEELAKLANGNTTTFLSKKVPLRDQDGNTVGILGISIDITKQKQAENSLAQQIKKTEAALQSRMEFISIASHEIRGPMANIITCLELVKLNANTFINKIINDTRVPQDLKDEALKEHAEYLNFIELMKTEGERGIGSLSNLDSLYRLKTDGLTSNRTAIFILDFIEKIIAQLAPQNKNKIQFVVEIHPEISQALLDYMNLRDVLQIIIINAMRFSREDGVVKINVEVQGLKDKSKVLVFSVQDHGIGMSKIHLENLFGTLLDVEPSLSEKRRYSKPSLQLSIADMKIKFMGGEIKIASESKVGTTVTAQVPYFPLELAKIKNLEENLAHDSIPANVEDRSLHLLLVEDDSVTAMLEQQQLEELQHHVDRVTSGEEALKLLEKNNYDIAFIDVTLPGMNGLDVIRAAKALGNKDTAYVVVTSHSSEEDTERFLREDVMTVLSKPTSKQDFKICIEAVLATKEDLND